MYICSCSLFLEPAVSCPSGRHVKSPLLTSPYTWQTSQSVTDSPPSANLSLPCMAKSHSPPAFPPLTMNKQQGKGVQLTVCCPLSVPELTTPRHRDATISHTIHKDTQRPGIQSMYTPNVIQSLGLNYTALKSRKNKIAPPLP